MRYSIPECNIESLEKKVNKIRNKCAKYGCEFKYERVGERVEEVNYKDEETGVVSTVAVKFIDVECEGVAAINGWKFAATLEYTEKGNVINGVPGIEIPHRFYDCVPWCEHCKTRRDRKSSFVVFNEETGEFKQVGKSCLKDYTGGLSVEAAAYVESFFKLFEEEKELGERFGSWGKKYYKVKEFMVCCAEAIRLYGFAKSDGFGKSTWDRARTFYDVNNHYRVWPNELKDYEDAVSRGLDLKRQESIELTETVMKWAVENESEVNYFHNLKVACSLEWADRNLGLLASAFQAYKREKEIEAEKAAWEAKTAEAAEKSRWLGKVGDKVKILVAEFSVVSTWETQFGVTHVYKFVDKDGCEATWKTGNYLDYENIVGAEVTGKIKELKEWRGIKQTELTRCRVEYAEKGVA